MTKLGRTALITGVGGQDAAYLAALLVGQGYRVLGTSRRPGDIDLASLSRTGVADAVEVLALDPADGAAVRALIEQRQPEEIYHLAGQSSVGLSFELPRETVRSIVDSALHLLEALRTVHRSGRLFVAGSGDCYGDTGGCAADESTPLRPTSPYAVAKACTQHLTATYRQAYGLHASTGILFNHESPLRPERFVTQKIVRAAARIAAGSAEVLKLGNLDIERDWGWAPDYVDAMVAMLSADEPRDLVIASGRTVSLAYFVACAFSHFGLDWQAHVLSDNSLFRPTDIARVSADPGLAHRKLGWRASKPFEDIVTALCEQARHDVRQAPQSGVTPS